MHDPGDGRDVHGWLCFDITSNDASTSQEQNNSFLQSWGALIHGDDLKKEP